MELEPEAHGIPAWVGAQGVLTTLSTKLHDVIVKATPGTNLQPLAGLRAVAAIFLPLVILGAPHQISPSLMAAFGAMFTLFCDIGGSYRRRLVATGTATAVGALLVGLGATIGGPPSTDMLAIFVATFVSGLLMVYGPEVTSIGLSLTIGFIMFFLSLSAVPEPPLNLVGGYLLGGALAMLLVLAPALWHRHDHATQSEQPQHPLADLRSELTLASPMFRYALLRALGAAGAAWLGRAWGLPYPYWAAYAVLICTWPSTELSITMTVQNVVGSMLGALVAGALIETIQDPTMFALLVIAAVFLTFLVRAMNNTFFAFFMTLVNLLVVSYLSFGLSFAPLWRFELLLGAGIALVVVVLQTHFSQRYAPVAPTGSTAG